MVEPDLLLHIARDFWPWADSSVDEVRAEHVLEHIHPGEPFFAVMRELYRVCKPGAQVLIVLPHPSHDIFLNDPTHRQALMPGTFAMFNKRYVEALAAKGDILTPFYKYLGVDFYFEKVQYLFDESVDKNDPNLARRAKHERNIIFQWSTTLTVMK
jgi:ubiquinone/menaquinone biosynthesis C-methylase UbiE